MKDNELLKPNAIEEEPKYPLHEMYEEEMIDKHKLYAATYKSFDEMCKEAIINKYKLYATTYNSYGCYISPYGYSDLVDEIFWRDPYMHYYKFNEAEKIIKNTGRGIVADLINNARLKKLAGNDKNMIDEFRHVRIIKAFNVTYSRCADIIDNIPEMLRTIISQRYALSFTLSEYLSRYGGYDGIYADFWALNPRELPQIAIIEDDDIGNYNLLWKMVSEYGGQVMYISSDVIESSYAPTWLLFRRAITDKKSVRIVGRDIFIKPTAPIRLITCPTGYAKEG